VHETIREFEDLLGLAPQLLSIPEADAARPLGDGKWSRKEILGHLIDSASNNHQRFVRLQLEDELRLPSYSQNEWVDRQHYAVRAWGDLVELWLAYNRHLKHVVENVDPASLGHIWHSSGGPVSLEFIIVDYLRHMRHHLEQILGRALTPVVG
jgi:DinB superfamily